MKGRQESEREYETLSYQRHPADGPLSVVAHQRVQPRWGIHHRDTQQAAARPWRPPHRNRRRNPPLAARPAITNALCQQLMTVAEANTIVQPATPAATIVSYNTDSGGSCNYVASQTRVPLIIYFLDWKGPVPIPQSDIAAALAEASGASKITINQATPIDGIGVQAEFVSATATGQGFTGSLTIFYVLEGPFFFDCFSFGPLTGGVLATQAQLQACATQVDSRLR